MRGSARRMQLHARTRRTCTALLVLGVNTSVAQSLSWMYKSLLQSGIWPILTSTPANTGR